MLVILCPEVLLHPIDGLKIHGCYFLTAALVFEGVGWFDVGAAVFCRRYDALLRWLLPYDGRMEAMSRSESISMLKSRLRPIDLPMIQIFSQSDVLAGHLSTGLI